MTDEEPTIDELIEASSLGSPEAMEYRRSTPPEVRDKVMGEMEERWKSEFKELTKDRDYGAEYGTADDGCMNI